MTEPIKLICESCGQEVEAQMHSHVAADGKRIEWPKAEIKSGQICFEIVCPNCGTRQQCMGKPSDA
jgi:Fe2+ or Zn2+ uptake regulation protein